MLAPIFRSQRIFVDAASFLHAQDAIAAADRGGGVLRNVLVWAGLVVDDARAVELYLQAAAQDLGGVPT